MKLGIHTAESEKSGGFTSAGFLLKNIAFTLANREAMSIWVFMSSGDLSSTDSQNGTSSSVCSLMHVSTIDQISLHKTSVAACGYLKDNSENESLCSTAAKMQRRT